METELLDLLDMGTLMAGRRQNAQLVMTARAISKQDLSPIALASVAAHTGVAPRSRPAMNAAANTVVALGRWDRAGVRWSAFETLMSGLPRWSASHLGRRHFLPSENID